MRRFFCFIAIIFTTCGGIEKTEFSNVEIKEGGKKELVTVLNDPADSFFSLGGNAYEIEVRFSAPIDPSTIPGNVLIHPVLGDVQNGENLLGEGIEVKNFKYSPDRKRFFFLFSVEPGEYVLHLKKEIKSITGEPLDGMCDGKNDPADVFSSGFGAGVEVTHTTLAFCEPFPTVSYMASPGNPLSFGDGAGCQGNENLRFNTEPVFLLSFSFPTGSTRNYFLAEKLGREIEIYDLTVGVRRPIYFSLDNGVSWRENIEDFGIVRIPENYYVYIKPIPLDKQHRFVLRINRFEGLKDGYGIPFWDGSPDEDNVYEVCFTTRGESETLVVGGIEEVKTENWVTGIRVWFDTLSDAGEYMDYSTLVPENFRVEDVDEGRTVPFDLEVHRETFVGKERDVVYLKIRKGELDSSHTRKLVISYKVMDFLGNTLDGNENGYIEGDSRDNFVREWK